MHYNTSVVSDARIHTLYNISTIIIIPGPAPYLVFKYRKHSHLLRIKKDMWCRDPSLDI